MKITLVNKNLNEYRFDLSFDEVRDRIYECVKPTNPSLIKSKIRKHPRAKEFIAEYINSSGFEVKMSIGIPNLCRYFGSRILHINDDGSMYVRRVVTDRRKEIIVANNSKL